MPSPRVVQKALSAISRRYSDYEYFFSQLQSPEWMRPLWDAGLFRIPPKPIEDQQSVRLPPWPESRYLARMASIQPKVVL